MELYKTIREAATEQQIIEKSRFIANVKPVETREEADAFIAEIKGRYKDATHNVPAMVLGDKCQIQWASDDGEPQGTSGAPMVQMIVSQGLTNIAVVVTRYFGGIKLGTGGLVRAYTGSCRQAIEAAGICSVAEMSVITVKVAYQYFDKLQNMAASEEEAREMRAKDDGVFFVIDGAEYAESVTLKIITTPEVADDVKKLLANVTSGSAEIVEEQQDIKKI